jgi:hypothetical protein
LYLAQTSAFGYQFQDQILKVVIQGEGEGEEKGRELEYHLMIHPLVLFY